MPPKIIAILALLIAVLVLVFSFTGLDSMMLIRLLAIGLALAATASLARW